MQRIIKNNQIVDETWHLLPKDTAFDELTNCDDYIVPLQMWRDHAHVLKARDGGLGVWLDADEEAEEIGDDVQHFQVIALNFPAFTDGRQAALLEGQAMTVGIEQGKVAMTGVRHEQGLEKAHGCVPSVLHA